MHFPYLKAARAFLLVSIVIVCTFYVQKAAKRSGSIQQILSYDSESQYHSPCHLVQEGSNEPKKQRCYPLLINYADRCCKRAQENNCRTALNNGVRQCVSFNKSIFNDDPGFMHRNQHILNRSRGAGYWLWKPYVIFRELHLARDGDIIIYSDSAVDVTKNIRYLTDLTAVQDIIVFQLKHWHVRRLAGEALSLRK